MKVYIKEAQWNFIKISNLSDLAPSAGTGDTCTISGNTNVQWSWFLDLFGPFSFLYWTKPFLILDTFLINFDERLCTRCFQSVSSRKDFLIKSVYALSWRCYNVIDIFQTNESFKKHTVVQYKHKTNMKNAKWLILVTKVKNNSSNYITEKPISYILQNVSTRC